ncbi:hypothetical protein WBP06_10660 [Novosphingobium sp. BL-8H]|uniref:hypothetical protein n=1 Tax=Novosphingobium sp. BL-8H TaxID=3127640 RepID=UPI003757FA43
MSNLAGNSWGFVLSFLWIAAVIIGSALFRRSRGKPLFPKAPENAQFAEKGRSGRSLGGLISRVGGARNCLLVFVCDDRLIVTPQFPFNLMFLPEIYRLDVDVPIDTVTSITPIGGLFRKALRIEFGQNGVPPVELFVHNEDRFISALGRKTLNDGSRNVEAPLRAKKPRKLTTMRCFFAIWSTGALFASATGLREDLRFRREGAIAIATFANPDEQIDGQTKMGVLTYEVAGASYRIDSIWGVGLFKIGDRENVYFTPSDPQNARESDNFHFDLLWLGLGTATLAIALFAGVIAKRIW